MPTLLVDLVRALDIEQRLGSELLAALPRLSQALGHIEFESLGGVQVPTFPQINESAKGSSLNVLLQRVVTSENLSQDLISQFGKILASANLLNASPYWRQLALTLADAATDNPLYRAESTDGTIRFPYDALNVVQLDRKFETDGAKIGRYLLPTYNSVIEDPLVGQSVNTGGTTVVGTVGYSVVTTESVDTNNRVRIVNVSSPKSGVLKSFRYRPLVTTSHTITFYVVTKISSSSFSATSSQTVTVAAGVAHAEQTIVLNPTLPITSGQYIGAYSSNFMARKAISSAGFFVIPGNNLSPATLSTQASIHLVADIYDASFGGGTGSFAGTINASQYPAFSKDITYTVTDYYVARYGYYWRWYNYYYAYQRQVTTTVTTPLNGSLLGQTFKLSNDRIVVGINLWCKTPGTTGTDASPEIYLCETQLGFPRYDRVLAKAILQSNSNSASTENIVDINFLLDRPVWLQANVPYALILKTSATFEVYYSANVNATGNLFYSQGGDFWSAALDKDLSVDFVVATFDSTSFEVYCDSLSLSGGIASLDLKKIAQFPAGTGVEVLIKVNDAWVPISAMETLRNLPAYAEMKMAITGTQYLCPLLDTQESTVTVFRPDDEFKYYSQSRAVQKELMKVSYHLLGYKELYHTFYPKLWLDGVQSLSPVAQVMDVGEESTKVTATFEIPLSATQYQHFITGGTQTAQEIYEVTSVIEII